MFWSKRENRVEQTCRLLSHVWISRKRGALSLLNIKIASFPAMTLSHEFSTSPTTSSSPPSRTHTHTAALQTEHNTLYSVQIWMPPDMREKKEFKKKGMSQERWDKRKNMTLHALRVACSGLLSFAERGSGWIYYLLCCRIWPDQVLTQWHETFSSKTHFHKTKLGNVKWNQSKKGEQIMAIFQCGVWRQLFGSIRTCRITYLCV